MTRISCVVIGVASLLVVVGCGDSGSGATQAGDVGTTDGAGATSTGGATPTTSGGSSTEDAATGAASHAATGFIEQPDLGPDAPIQCDTFTQDCPEARNAPRGPREAAPGTRSSACR